MQAGVEPPAGAAVAVKVAYALDLAAGSLPLNPLVSGPFTLRFTGVRSCTVCGRRVKKLYGQGLCYDCLRTAPEAAPCIIRPELCRAHLREGRDVQWELDHHLQEHVVYLAYTGDVKVGITRATQVPVRWIDQGAVLAVPIARVPYRQLAGAIEVDLKRCFSDRTDWRRMLLLPGPGPGVEALGKARELALREVAPALGEYMLAQEAMVQLDYPLAHVPPKLVSVGLEKLPVISGRLQGIKGQYLVWSDGLVLNVRNHAGFHVEVEAV